jgi:hypothetical protein
MVQVHLKSRIRTFANCAKRWIFVVFYIAALAMYLPRVTQVESFLDREMTLKPGRTTAQSIPTIERIFKLGVGHAHF